MESNSLGTLIIRTDANSQIGIGHFMRCLAIAQAWKDHGGKSLFMMGTFSLPLELQLKSEGIEVLKIPATLGSIEDTIKTIGIAKEVMPFWIILDGYHLDSNYQKKIKEEGFRIMVIDDMAHLPNYHGDILLNQNIHAEKLNYSAEPNTKLLLGTKYVLLRREFLGRKVVTREIPKIAKRVLITMGGSDPENITLKVIQAIKELNLNDIEVAIVIGPDNPHADIIKEEISLSPFPFNIFSHVKDISELMCWADLAISAGGSTSWELAFMGVPNIVIYFAENQKEVAENLHKEQVAFNLGHFKHVEIKQIKEILERLIFDKDLRIEMSKRGKELVDGEGVDRVLMNLKGDRIRLRKVREEDCELLWRWANDPEVRRVSFSSEPILWEEHKNWFRSKISDQNCIFYIALEKNDIPIGQTRFDIKGDEANISISLDKIYRGKGYGNELIKISSERIFNDSKVNLIHAYVKNSNKISAISFLKAGYIQKEITEINNHTAVHFILNKTDLKCMNI